MSLFKTLNDIPGTRMTRLPRQVNGNAGTKMVETEAQRAARIERFRLRVHASTRALSQKLDRDAAYFHRQQQLAELVTPWQREYESNKAALAALASSAPKLSL